MNCSDNSAKHHKSKLQDELNELNALKGMRHSIDELKLVLPIVWQWGDGKGGYVLSQIRSAVIDAGLIWPHDPVERKTKKKAKIPRTISRQVFERDFYRCVFCGTHVDLCCDHIIPESKGGKATLQNLQTLCRSCNSKKGSCIQTNTKEG